MIFRISRLIRAEFVKLTSQWFFYIAICLTASIVPLAIYLQTPSNEGGYAQLNAIQLFAYGAKYGLKVASLFVVIFASMIFAGEFDKGTIKCILTRPVTRTDVFIAKSITALLLSAILVAIALYVSLLYGMMRGELGHIWDTDFYHIKTAYSALTENLTKAIIISLPSFIAAVFFGILISNITENSGYAVAISLTLFIVLDLLSGFSFLSDNVKYIFNYYPSYALSVLGTYVEGYSTLKWKENITKYFLSIPLAYSALFSVIAYFIFRMKNIQT